jgi:hypothetical protein
MPNVQLLIQRLIHSCSSLSIAGCCDEQYTDLFD